MQRFDGKVILVTGAASGIGLASAAQFAREGGTVIATDINSEGLEQAIAALRDEGLAIEAQAQDVTDQDQWVEVVRGIVERHGHLDVLFNNAGGGHFALLEETTLEQWTAFSLACRLRSAP